MESVREIRVCVLLNLEKARVMIAGIVLDGVPFMEEFGLHLIITHMKNKT